MVGNFCFEHDFLAPSGFHGLDGQVDEVRGDAVLSVAFGDDEHGNVAAKDVVMWTEFTYDATNGAMALLAIGIGGGHDGEEAVLWPLQQEVPIRVDGVGFGQLCGDQIAQWIELFFCDIGQVLDVLLSGC